MFFCALVLCIASAAHSAQETTVLVVLENQPFHGIAEKVNATVEPNLFYLEQTMKDLRPPARRAPSRVDDLKDFPPVQILTPEVKALGSQYSSLIRSVREQIYRETQAEIAVEQDAVAAQIRDLGGRILYRYFILNALAVSISEDKLPLVSSIAGVDRVMKDRTLKAHLNTSSRSMGAGGFWSAGYKGDNGGARIGLLDSGVKWDHNGLSPHSHHDKVFHKSAQNEGDYDDFYYLADFETGSYPNWTPYISDGCLFEVTANEPYRLHMDSPEDVNGHAWGKTEDIFNMTSQNYIIEFDFMIPSVDLWWIIIMDNHQIHLVVDRKSETEAKLLAAVDAEGSVHYDRIMNLSSNQWYHLKLVVDQTADSYEIWVDGKNKRRDEDFFYGSAFSYLRMGDLADEDNYGEAYWDDINVYVFNDAEGHGTAVAGCMWSEGYDCQQKDYRDYDGVAYKEGNCINAKAGWRDTLGNPQMQWTDAMAATEWAVNEKGADILNFSYGSNESWDPPGYDDSDFSRFWDAVVHDLHVSVAVSAGNDGANGVDDPGIAYNVISVGAVADVDDTNRANDYVADYSARGPTDKDRAKPDLVAPGGDDDYPIYTTDRRWGNCTVSDYTGTWGTSFASPHVAGAIALLAQSLGYIPDPKVAKAVLINTADFMGSSGWSSSAGWGYVNLNNTYVHKEDWFHFGIEAVDTNGPDNPPDSYELYKGIMYEDDKATLVWNRYAKYDPDDYPQSYSSSIKNLGLSVYRISDNALLYSSLSDSQNVEQVEATADSDSVAIKVHFQGNIFPMGYYEKYALATEEGFSGATFSIISTGGGSFDQNGGSPSGAPIGVTNEASNKGDVPGHENLFFIIHHPDLVLVFGDSIQVSGKIEQGDADTFAWFLEAPPIQPAQYFAGVLGFTTSFEETLYHEYIDSFWVTPVTVTVIPDEIPTIVPPEGGDVEYDATFMSYAPTPLTIGYWATTDLDVAPAPIPVTLQPFETLTVHYDYYVPESAPHGEYTLTGHVGASPTAWYHDAFEFIKLKTPAKRTKDKALVLLGEILSSPLDKKMKKDLEKAVKEIIKSLEYFETDSTLSEKQGKKTFDKEKKAAKKIRDAAEKAKKEEVPVWEDCRQVCLYLVDADRSLAQTAINMAKNMPLPDEKKIKKAEKEMEKAEKELLRPDKRMKKLGVDWGRYDKAIDHYRRAWEHAKKAMKHKAQNQMTQGHLARRHQFRLYPVSPNPVIGHVMVQFALEKREKATVKVYDVSGRTITTLMAGEMDSGLHSTSWSGLDSRGRRVPSGVYFLRLSTPDKHATEKMLLLR